MTRRVQVLLATYDGARYLDAQVESILGQAGVETVVLARDDGSTDGTVERLNAFAARWPDRFAVLGARDHRGAAGAFGELLAQATADRVFLSDQDDVWRPDKVERSLRVLDALEERHGGGTPLLVHTDLQIVDEDLRPRAASFWASQGLDPAFARRVARLLVRNVVTGCTVAMNRALLQVALPVPPEAYMHDWWLALVAAAAGAVGEVDAPTVLYRQHRSNAIGSEALGWRAALRDRARVRRYYARTRRQAGALAHRLGDRLPPPVARLVRDYAALTTRGPLARRAVLLRHGIRDAGPLRSLALLALGTS